MSEPKSFASLGPTLLARKGGARPAMRTQFQAYPNLAENDAEGLEDLGWNDMGDDRHPGEVIQLTPPPAHPDALAESAAIDRETAAELAEAQRPAVLRQQDAIVHRIAAPARPVESRPRRSALEDGRRAAFTLRLDTERHLKLRLACTIRNRSAQQIVTAALDLLLSEMPELEALASQVNRK